MGEIRITDEMTTRQIVAIMQELRKKGYEPYLDSDDFMTFVIRW